MEHIKRSSTPQGQCWAKLCCTVQGSGDISSILFSWQSSDCSFIKQKNPKGWASKDVSWTCWWFHLWCTASRHGSTWQTLKLFSFLTTKLQDYVFISCHFTACDCICLLARWQWLVAEQSFCRWHLHCDYAQPPQPPTHTHHHHQQKRQGPHHQCIIKTWKCPISPPRS